MDKDRNGINDEFADECLKTIREAREKAEAEYAQAHPDHGRGCIDCMEYRRSKCPDCLSFSMYRKIPNRFYNHTDEQLSTEHARLTRALKKAAEEGNEMRAASLLPELESEIKRRRRGR